PGSMRSRTTRSGRPVSTSSSTSPPSEEATTSKPSRSRLKRNVAIKVGSSSTTRMRVIQRPPRTIRPGDGWFPQRVLTGCKCLVNRRDYRISEEGIDCNKLVNDCNLTVHKCGQPRFSPLVHLKRSLTHTRLLVTS